MATTMKLSVAHGLRTRHLSIFEKARALNVYRVEGDASSTLIVSSGSEPHKAYRVWHNGVHAERCNCRSEVLCSHMIAASDFLANELYRK